MQQLHSTPLKSLKAVSCSTWQVNVQILQRPLVSEQATMRADMQLCLPVQLASGGASYICNTAFAAKEQLQLPCSAFPTISQTQGKKVSLDVDRELHLQGLPNESLHKAKQAWQKLLLERLHYLQ